MRLLRSHNFFYDSLETQVKRRPSGARVTPDPGIAIIIFFFFFSICIFNKLQGERDEIFFQVRTNRVQGPGGLQGTMVPFMQSHPHISGRLLLLKSVRMCPYVIYHYCQFNDSPFLHDKRSFFSIFAFRIFDDKNVRLYLNYELRVNNRKCENGFYGFPR